MTATGETSMEMWCHPPRDTLLKLLLFTDVAAFELISLLKPIVWFLSGQQLSSEQSPYHSIYTQCVCFLVGQVWWSNRPWHQKHPPTQDCIHCRIIVGQYELLKKEKWFPRTGRVSGTLSPPHLGLCFVSFSRFVFLSPCPHLSFSSQLPYLYLS